jgi:serine/threonine protein kinase
MARPTAASKSKVTARYQLLERVATGGMAELFKARVVGPEGFDKLVAVKRILPAFSSNQEFVGMFIDEARLAAQLSHPNVVQVFELGRDVDENLFISMELVYGPELATLIDRLRQKRRRMPEAAALEVMIQVLRGLHHAHVKTDLRGRPLHLVHRDVSPQNVLVTTEGVAKLLDFGVAKARGRLTETQAGLVKGKLIYMSPEQSRNKPIDARTDQFAAGLVLWECLAGEPCYTYPTEVELLRAVALGQTRTLESVGVQVDPELEATLMAALAKDPDQRFANCEDFADALLRYKQRTYPSYTPSMLGKLLAEACPREVETLTRVPDLEGPNVVPLHVASLDLSTIDQAMSGRSRLALAAGATLAVIGLLGGGGALYARAHAKPLRQVVVTQGATQTITNVVYRETAKAAPLGFDLDGGVELEQVELLDGGRGQLARLADGHRGWVLRISDGSHVLAIGLADGGRVLVPIDITDEAGAPVAVEPVEEVPTTVETVELADGGSALVAHLQDGGTASVDRMPDGHGEIYLTVDGGRVVVGEIELPPLPPPGQMEVSAVRLEDGGVGYPATLADGGEGEVVRLEDGGLAVKVGTDLTAYEGVLPLPPRLATTRIESFDLDDGGTGVTVHLVDGGEGNLITLPDGTSALEVTGDDGHTVQLPFALPGGATKR